MPVDEELFERLARLRGIPPAAARSSDESGVNPEEFLSKFPKITSSKGQDANTPIDIQKLLEEVSRKSLSAYRGMNLEGLETFYTKMKKYALNRYPNILASVELRQLLFLPGTRFFFFVEIDVYSKKLWDW